uniref:C2H2-type domain-containing protein n=1 Tax=Neogobius melanostomus TaxID=47308 RepID=A0A8C6TAP9_9GOBI
MEEVKLELWEPAEVENGAVEELKEDPDCGDDLSLDEASPSLVQIKEELEEQMILQESIFAFPVIVSVKSEKEESLLPETFKEEDREGENSSDTDDSVDWTTSAESPTPQTHTDKQERPFICSVCARTFTRKYYLQLHTRTHQNNRPFSCSICAKDFTRKCYLQLHLKTHRGQRLYQNKHEDQDKGHRKKKSKGSSLHLTVTEENSEGRDGAGLEKHSENSFDDSGNCTFSAERTSRGESDLTHVNDPTKDATIGKVTSLKCSQCGKQFQRLGMFKRHMSNHQTERPFTCSVCKKAFTLKYHLQLHMRTHQTERPFRCAVCSKTFTQKCYLQLHLKTHREQRLFQTKQKDQANGDKAKKVKRFFLNQTEKKNTAEVGLEEHSDTDHSGDWIPTPETPTEGQLQLFSCTVCSRKFTRKYYLQLHSKAHQKDQALSCAVCSRKFTRKYYLQLHSKAHQKIRLSAVQFVQGSSQESITFNYIQRLTKRSGFKLCSLFKEVHKKVLPSTTFKGSPKYRPFSCAVCAKNFKQKCYLQLHLKTHREQRLYKTKQKDNGDGDKKVKKSSLHQQGKRSTETTQMKQRSV